LRTRYSNLVAPVLGGSAFRFCHVADALLHLQVVAHARAVFLVLAVQRYVADRRSGTAAPLLVAGFGFGQQPGAGQRDDDRTSRGGQQDGYDAHHHDRPGVYDVVLVFVVESDLQYGRSQSGLKTTPRAFLKTKKKQGKPNCNVPMRF